MGGGGEYKYSYVLRTYCVLPTTPFNPSNFLLASLLLLQIYDGVSMNGVGVDDILEKHASALRKFIDIIKDEMKVRRRRPLHHSLTTTARLVYVLKSM